MFVGRAHLVAGTATLVHTLLLEGLVDGAPAHAVPGVDRPRPPGLSGGPDPARPEVVRTGDLPERDVYVVSVVTTRAARVPASGREHVTDVGAGIRRVELRYGFMEETRVADDLERHLRIEPHRADYFLGRESIRSTEAPGMARWRERLFTVMVHNSADVGAHYHLPGDRVIEIGQRLQM